MFIRLDWLLFQIGRGSSGSASLPREYLGGITFWEVPTAAVVASKGVREYLDPYDNFHRPKKVLEQ
jgi:hypothetical protein